VATEKVAGKRGRSVTGLVTSDKMDKTITVSVTKRRVHDLYKKYVKYTKKLKAHDEANEAKLGDRVRIVESRPLSRDKRWRLVEIVERAR